MVEERNYGELGPSVTMQLKEGDMTISEISTARGLETGATFTSQIKKGDLVAIAGDMLVEKVTASTTPTIVGVVEDEPQFQGQEPTESATEGNYVRRIAAVRLFGAAVRTVELVSTNAAITPGDPIKNTGQKFDKASSSTDKIALESASAKSGGKIAVLFGHYYK